ncbi:MAG: helix-turn-helix transcriptional regulator [Lachnospiraceae bacterium]|nr:helix-turn-helix transcriptional regulator [Lachnospiraceae bacterium]
MKIYTFKGKKNLCGSNIRIARAQKQITQSDLAAKVQIEGITLERDSISRIEIGTRFVTDYELKVFAKVLNVSVEWLLDGESF